MPGLSERLPEQGAPRSVGAEVAAAALRPLDVARLILSAPFSFMLALLVLEALLSATTTWLVIQASRDVAVGRFIVADLVWIFLAQAASYISGAASWIFAEQAGYRAYGRYILRFARLNRGQPMLLGDRHMREQVEPFLTGETFTVFYLLMYELEGDLKLLLGLAFNAFVLGMEISGGLPAAYVLVFCALLLVQAWLRDPIGRAYRQNQEARNRMTVQAYTAWDNVFSGNRYNLRLWLAGFKTRLRSALRAQIKAVAAREGISAAGGIVALAVVIGVMIAIAAGQSDAAVLIAMAATLPRQIEMTQDVNELASGWNELIAIWARLGGVTENLRPAADPAHDQRIQFRDLVLRDTEGALGVRSVEDALATVLSRPTGRLQLRGGNGAGKSSLLAALKRRLGRRAYYWPTHDRLAFQFGEVPADKRRRRKGYSSGERQLRALREIVEQTDSSIYLFDEWDANLDKRNRQAAEALMEALAQRARVVEISHRE